MLAQLPEIKMTTISLKPAEVEKKWVLIDAEGLVVGRLAAIVARRLRGKHLPAYTPHVDCGDNVVIINAGKVALTGRKRDEKMPNVPTIHELMNEYKTPEATRTLAVAILASGDLGRPFVTPPAVPAERLKILRDAFRKTMSDPEFLADVKLKKLEINPDYGEDLEALAKQVVSQPREIAERIKKLLGGE